MRTETIKRLFCPAILILFLFTSQAYSQKSEVRACLNLAAYGKPGEAIEGYKSLVGKYPQDPGVMYLGAVLQTDADKAAAVYKKIINEMPGSEWADDSYWRIVQYYAISGDIKAAERELALYKKKYPTSEFLGPANDVVNSARQIAGDSHGNESTQTEKQVKTQAPPNNENPGKYGSEFTTSYGLQVGIYSTKKAADAEKRKYLQKRVETGVYSKTVDGLVMFAVVIGNYSSLRDAEAAKNTVEDICGCNPLIFKKANTFSNN